ncbi:coenzyme F420-0:L-glutamate ligase [Candidatus Microgenomates bacterium]|nr:coenzyme F420-0:L-glutamate ligase [Candidatus Microgenomates bacterium]
MIITPIKLRILNPPKDDLLAAIDQAISQIKEESILVVASKVVSVWQGRCVPVSDYPNKDALVKKEADMYLMREFAPRGWVMHTIKDSLLIPTAGIDLSNANGFYILWPKNPMKAARDIRDHLKKRFGLEKIGVLIIDSHSVPLHRGTVGITLGFEGINPVRDYRGTHDLFGREFVVEMSNIADELASAALLVMGEGAQATPVALASDIPYIEFVDKYVSPKNPSLTFVVDIDEDLYGPFIKSAPWKKGKK